MDQQTASLLHKIATLEQQMAKQGAAANFVITHMIKLLDEQSGDSQFSSKLRETLSESLDKLNHSQSAPIKSAINELLQPSVQIMFQPKPEKFIKVARPSGRFINFFIYNTDDLCSSFMASPS